jgi:hypothetical protein
MLQRDDTDLSAAASLFKTTKTNLAEMRNNFDSFVGESSSVVQCRNIKPDIKLRCRRAAKKFYDEVAFDSLFRDPLKRFQVTVFNSTLDIANNQLDTLFTGIKNIVENLSFL